MSGRGSTCPSISSSWVITAWAYYALDTSQRDGDDESPVVIWASDRSQERDALEVVAPDFGSFLLQAIEEEFGPA